MKLLIFDMAQLKKNMQLAVNSTIFLLYEFDHKTDLNIYNLLQT